MTITVHVVAMIKKPSDRRMFYGAIQDVPTKNEMPIATVQFLTYLHAPEEGGSK
jgi:hypothetical protein